MEERMKRVFLIVVAVVMAVSVSTAFAQGAAASSDAESSGESALYPVRVDVARVYTHSQGYRVVYRKGQASLAEVYLPSSWFVAGGQAMMLRGRGREYPYMVVYYKADGSFSHVKLYVLSNMRDSTWGIIEGDPGDKFKVDTIKLEF